MAKARWCWAVLADETRAKLLHCGPTEMGRPHIKQVETLQFEWAGHEHGRPSPLKAKNGHTHAAEGHEKEEDRRRFAQTLADWIEKQLHHRGIDRLTVFGPPRFLGALRRAWPDRLAERIREHPHELINLPNPELHQHPAIRELIGLPTNNRV
ncbi:MAG: host attachment protein [Phycisphaeraceae bacterium]